MSFDLADLRSAVAVHGRIARVVIAAVSGSAPRETGTSMLVWDGGQSGTIGGGALELDATTRAFERTGATRHALGPALGQCCGGAVTLWTETFDTQSIAALADQDVLARGPGDMPLAVRRVLDQARAHGVRPDVQMVQGWLIEPMTEARVPLWIWGAGHVGRALVDVLTPLPDFDITWADTSAGRFPDTPSDCVTILPAADPAMLVPHAPENAMHLVLTYSHELDFQLCHALLQHRFGFAGVIGSDTKWARFRKRLRTLGHEDAQIRRIFCPIGQKSLGKHPHAIAVGVTSQLLTLKMRRDGANWQKICSASQA